MNTFVSVRCSKNSVQHISNEITKFQDKSPKMDGDESNTIQTKENVAKVSEGSSGLLPSEEVTLAEKVK